MKQLQHSAQNAQGTMKQLQRSAQNTQDDMNVAAQFKEYAM